jgi:single stranded DNA-binding protein
LSTPVTILRVVHSAVVTIPAPALISGTVVPRALRRGADRRRTTVNETWVTVVGNVASDVSWKRTPNGGEVANFRLMSTERRYDAESGSWEDGLRVAVRVSCWRRLGENVRACVAKGDPVVVRGRLAVREFEVDGVRRTSTEIEARSVGHDLARVCAKVAPAEPAAGGRPVLDVTGLAVLEEPPAQPADADPDADEMPTPIGTLLGASAGVGAVDAENDGDDRRAGRALAS